MEYTEFISHMRLDEQTALHHVALPKVVPSRRIFWLYYCRRGTNSKVPLLA